MRSSLYDLLSVLCRPVPPGLPQGPVLQATTVASRSGDLAITSKRGCWIIFFWEICLETFIGNVFGNFRQILEMFGKFVHESPEKFQKFPKSHSGGWGLLSHDTLIIFGWAAQAFAARLQATAGPKTACLSGSSHAFRSRAPLLQSPPFWGEGGTRTPRGRMFHPPQGEGEEEQGWCVWGGGGERREGGIEGGSMGARSGQRATEHRPGRRGGMGALDAHVSPYVFLAAKEACAQSPEVSAPPARQQKGGEHDGAWTLRDVGG